MRLLPLLAQLGLSRTTLIFARKNTG